MKILRIAGANLASLGEPFEVDFESGPLATAGVFAIGGPTGAGKSTLLDALCLALYDATPRLARAGRGAATLPDVGEELVSPFDPRTLLRRGAAEGHAEVDFVGHDNARYRARWSVRRARTKATGALQKSSLTLHRLADGVALGGTKTEVAQEIAARVGLSFEQFTRAVLLAQNEFSAFLKTDESERGELLETLTGTEIYTRLSQRALERYREEQARLQLLSARLADGMPMASEQRAQMEADAAAAALDLEAARAERDAAEAQWRWHEDDARLARGIAEASAALEQAQAVQQEAAPRRRRVHTIDALQPARSLMEDVSRLQAESAAIEEAGVRQRDELEESQLAARTAHANVEAAQAELQVAEQAQRNQVPLLDAAKALDARIATLQPGHAAARKALDDAAAAAAQAQSTLDTIGAERNLLAACHQRASAWLDEHSRIAPLAAQWARWQKLLADAARTSELEASLDSAQKAALERAQHARHEAERANETLANSDRRVQELEAVRRAAVDRLAEFDRDAMRKQREGLEARRDSITLAERRWTRLEAATSTLRDTQAKLLQAQASIDTARAEREQLVAGAAALAAALIQAESSLAAARAACGDSVERLRATLEDGKPCPVCGSEAHPYHHQDEVLRVMLSSLDAQVGECRAAVQANAERSASLSSTISHCRAQADALADDISRHQQAHAAAWKEWASDPHHVHEGVDGAWFAAQAEQLQTAGDQLALREIAARAALEARERAQAECEEAAAARAAAQNAATSAQVALLESNAQADAAREKQQTASATLSGLLDELDGAFDSAAWCDDWHDNPARFQQVCERSVSAWNEQSEAQVAARQKLVSLEAIHSAARERQIIAASLSATAHTQFAEAEQHLSHLRTERAAILDGRAVADVEQQLAATVTARREALVALQQAGQQAAHAEIRVREALDQTLARGGACRAALADAVAMVERWIATFQAAHTELDAASDASALAALLATDPGWLEAERQTLAKAEADVAAASTILAERREQQARHRDAPHAAVAAHEGLAERITQARSRWEQLNNRLVGLRLQLEQDDARRHSAQTIMADLEKQQQIERRWGRMNELIGSSDGKRFRNYAQQFTLDVLLGYANSHLAQLAKRYRLERVPTAGGPSLGLLVRDQDMGGEVRSVNSLSGGESFLVSLALALGLASLSSNRVRVESLFIDEGFGSLDSETLRVAMDALDSLQAMGRKVGVISHVQEMAERISARILVQPGGAGLSTVTVA